MATLDYDTGRGPTIPLDQDTRRFFLFGVRIFFGLWLLYVGLVKWLKFKPANFIGSITSDFDKTWSPHGLNVVLAWLILICEPLFAVLILSGLWPRIVWSLVALLMFMLTLGQTILMRDTTSNWLFLLLALVCAALSTPVSRRT